MENTIFVLQGRGKIGKTTTIRRIHELICDKFDYERISTSIEKLHTKDITTIIRVNNSTFAHRKS